MFEIRSIPVFTTRGLLIWTVGLVPAGRLIRNVDVPLVELNASVLPVIAYVEPVVPVTETVALASSKFPEMSLFETVAALTACVPVNSRDVVGALTGTAFQSVPADHCVVPPLTFE